MTEKVIFEFPSAICVTYVGGTYLFSKISLVFYFTNLVGIYSTIRHLYLPYLEKFCKEYFGFSNQFKYQFQHIRNNIIKVQSLIHNQLSSSRYKEMFKQAIIFNPVKFCFTSLQFKITHNFNCNEVVVLKCSWCKKFVLMLLLIIRGLYVSRSPKHRGRSSLRW